MISDLGGKANYFGYSESLFVDEKLGIAFPVAQKLMLRHSIN